MLRKLGFNGRVRVILRCDYYYLFTIYVNPSLATWGEGGLLFQKAIYSLYSPLDNAIATAN
jgi:hypothetical protein